MLSFIQDIRCRWFHWFSGYKLWGGSWFCPVCRYMDSPIERVDRRKLRAQKAAARATLSSIDASKDGDA